ncbi:LOW QUALITY PROTEIN: hypothetical protein Cgig2_014510 [Carnegiea gigantea]|uniref:Uncharacterized protein n=1 Tax=Carnegiea gigantea TaxID=171969 RepID=A0A9Q1KGK9_9CARY|nr:LOW QUALITY PROTEIN: hypothetical protein Cgig2_014510 [Carnegiea gigantea]
MHEEVLADLEGLRAENGEEQTNALDDIYAHYKDSYDADNPITSDIDDDDGDDKQRKKKKKRTIKYSRYNASSSKEGVELQASLNHSSNAIASPPLDPALAPPVSAYVASTFAHTTCVTCTDSFFVNTTLETVTTSCAHVIDALDFPSIIDFFDAATELPTIEFDTTTAARDAADIFINYIPKGKLPVRRNQVGEPIPTQNTLTFTTLDE